MPAALSTRLRAGRVDSIEVFPAAVALLQQRGAASTRSTLGLVSTMQFVAHASVQKQRDWILFTDEQFTVPVYARFTPADTRAAMRSKMQPSYQGTFTGGRKYVVQIFATTTSALMKQRVARFMQGQLCSSCQGTRLKLKSLSVTFAGLDIGALSQLPLTHVVAHVLTPAAAGQLPPLNRNTGLEEAKSKTKPSVSSWPPSSSGPTVARSCMYWTSPPQD